MNAANAGLIRLFCAQHVVDEVAEHSAGWTAGTEVPSQAFLDSWTTEYLPLIRVLRDDAIPRQLLTRDEGQRLETLRARDPDDIPSAILSITLGAFYMTNDGHALRAAYGSGVDLSMRSEWQQVLKAGGDAGQLGTTMQMAFGLAAALSSAGFQGIKALLRIAGLVGVVAGGAIAYMGYKRIGPETKKKLSSGAITTALFLGEVLGEYRAIQERFERAAPTCPTWTDLAEELSDMAVLARACLHTLARAGNSNCSAQELRTLLPVLPVPSGETEVRQVLRELPTCFCQVYAGRWQIGEVAEPVKRLACHMPQMTGE